MSKLTHIETKKDYARYCGLVSAFMESEGINCLTTRGDDCEPFFSWSPCDCCNRDLGGDRYKACGFNPTTKEIQDYEICTDCLYYAEYGQLDDQAMLDLKEESEA